MKYLIVQTYLKNNHSWIHNSQELGHLEPQEKYLDVIF